jgi:hypothetical protein
VLSRNGFGAPLNSVVVINVEPAKDAMAGNPKKERRLELGVPSKLICTLVIGRGPSVERTLAAVGTPLNKSVPSGRNGVPSFKVTPPMICNDPPVEKEYTARLTNGSPDGPVATEGPVEKLNAQFWQIKPSSEGIGKVGVIKPREILLPTRGAAPPA